MISLQQADFDRSNRKKFATGSEDLCGGEPLEIVLLVEAGRGCLCVNNDAYASALLRLCQRRLENATEELGAKATTLVLGSHAHAGKDQDRKGRRRKSTMRLTQGLLADGPRYNTHETEDVRPLGRDVGCARPVLELLLTSAIAKEGVQFGVATRERSPVVFLSESTNLGHERVHEGESTAPVALPRAQPLDRTRPATEVGPTTGKLRQPLVGGGFP